MTDSADRISRRRWLGSSSAIAAAVLGCDWNLVCNAIAAEDPKSVTAALNRMPRMVHEFFVDQLRHIERRSQQEFSELNSKDDALAYVTSIRTKIADCFGRFPERTPLNARVTGIVDRESYRIEKIIFESRPRFYVTANLYVPKKITGQVPGVVGSCGHSANGKAYPGYQAFCQGLTTKGYVVLIFDPIGQGERLQHPDEHLKSHVGAGVGEHLMVGNQQYLVGEFFGSWRAWDGIRSLDYLLSRPEVDPHRIGITGNSGGGTMTTWLCGVESHWTMAAPSCFVTSFRRNLENELPADTEQCPPRVLLHGLDHLDFLAAMAPKPIAVLAQEKDYFDIRGTIEAVSKLKRLYQLLGASSDDVRLHIGEGEHGYHKDAREAMYAHFNRVTGIEAGAIEPPLTPEDDQTLWCTKSGQITELDAKTVCSFTKDSAEQFAARRPTLRSQELRTAVREVLNLPDRKSVCEYRILRPRKTPNSPQPFCSNYLLEMEPGIGIIVYRQTEKSHSARPPQETNAAILYVAHDSCDVELRDEPLIRQVFEKQKNSTLYACDVRGLGESKPNTCDKDSYSSAYGCDYFYAAHSIMLGRPYVGQRTHDLLCVIDWLKAIGHGEIHVVARGYGTIPAAFAATLHDGVTTITLKNALSSYHDLACSDVYTWPLSSLTPGILLRFDLPDLYRELATKQLQLIETWGPDKKMRPPE